MRASHPDPFRPPGGTAVAHQRLVLPAGGKPDADHGLPPGCLRGGAWRKTGVTSEGDTWERPCFGDHGGA